MSQLVVARWTRSALERKRKGKEKEAQVRLSSAQSVCVYVSDICARKVSPIQSHARSLFRQTARSVRLTTAWQARWLERLRRPQQRHLRASASHWVAH